MVRYEIQARFQKVKDMKFGRLFKDGRTYKTMKSARNIVRKQEDFRPDLEFRVRAVAVKECCECGRPI